jgi:DNA adenine methylase
MFLRLGRPRIPAREEAVAQAFGDPRAEEQAVRTPLTYYGGKQALARQIVPLMPMHRVYLEPFAGGAAVLFAKPRAERETLNDADGQIMRFWRVLRDRPADLADAVATTPYGRAEWEAAREDVDADLESARRLLVNVDQSFSRSRRSWSVPCIGDGRGRWQPGTWANLPPKILAAATRLTGVALESGDALEMIPRWDRADAVIYLDPPYAGPLRLSPSHGYKVDESDLWSRLVPVLREVRHASVLLSGYPCAEALDLDWRMLPLAMKRTVQARDGSALPDAPEVLWLSPNVPVAKFGPLFAEAR